MQPKQHPMTPPPPAADRHAVRRPDEPEVAELVRVQHGQRSFARHRPTPVGLANLSLRVAVDADGDDVRGGVVDARHGGQGDVDGAGRLQTDHRPVAVGDRMPGEELTGGRMSPNVVACEERVALDEQAHYTI